ncbi:GNAT family N-acetyltransferase [Cohnella suwonensis]|uniref:GNAT family N-acetyltransferase n=1 Tax=Cohnella suwonensis TaxID=696072 RepID=A0ABW0LZ42_9BACL
MKRESTNEWNESLWLEAKKPYEEGFPERGRKNDRIVRRMLERRLCDLHVWRERKEAVAMALTAFDASSGLLVIDYLAVSLAWRGNGIGQACVSDLREWASGIPNCRGLVIEAEAEETEENTGRVAFWRKAGFRLTDYVHSYIWVPETYRAMVAGLREGDEPISDGKQLFKAITRYHEKAYRGHKEN